MKYKNAINQLLAIALTCFMLGEIQSQTYNSSINTRQKIKLNTGWKFIKSNNITGAESLVFDDSQWDMVSIPHTWQSLEDQVDYSHCWYRKWVEIPKEDIDKRIIVHFEAAGITTDVYVNGKYLGQHVGSYTAFQFDITDFIVPGKQNLISIRCDSKTGSRIRGNMSRMEDRKCYYWNVAGGIHRDVWLLKLNPGHLWCDYAGEGVRVTNEITESGKVDLTIDAMIRNTNDVDKTYSVNSTVCDDKDNIITSVRKEYNVKANTILPVSLKSEIENPKLWSISNPNLYTIYTELLDHSNVVDVVKVRTGFRSIKMDTSGHFILNGERVRLHGASLHERSEYNFHAPTEAELKTDIEFMEDIGFNSVFLSHYPFPHYMQSLCDEKGLLAWAENGYVRGSFDPEISTRIQKEQMYQYWNHPSIFCWSVGNECTDEQFENNVTQLIDLVKNINDPMRLITYNKLRWQNLSDPDLDFISESNFGGWYVEPGSENVWANTAQYINQVGGGGHIAMQQHYDSTYYKVDHYEPEAIQMKVAEGTCHLRYTQKVGDLFYWWQLKDTEGEKLMGLINSKGLITFANYKKDVYYLFKAFNRDDENVTHICGKHWFLRDANQLKIYSNSKQVTLYVNDKMMGTKNNGEYRYDNENIKHVFTWDSVLKPGINRIKCTVDGFVKDSCTIFYQQDQPDHESNLIVNLESTNGDAYYISMPVQDQWPFYNQFNGDALNTLDSIPGELRGAHWISSRRQSEKRWKTDLNFDINPGSKKPVNVYIMTDRTNHIPTWVSEAGFEPLNTDEGQWRNHYLYLVPYQLFVKNFKPGEEVQIRGSKTESDYLILLK